MNKVLKLMSIFVLAIIMAVSSLVIVSADETDLLENETITITASSDENQSREYELVWRFKSEYGHMYKRRWNMTLGMWYDPDWILVY